MMHEIKVRAFNIKWDTDGEKVKGLPKEAVLDVGVITSNETPSKEEIEDATSDALSDTYGFCHLGFEYEVVEG